MPRYPHLEAYETGLSLSEVAQLIGRHKVTVRRHLLKNDALKPYLYMPPLGEVRISKEGLEKFLTAHNKVDAAKRQFIEAHRKGKK